MPNKSIESFKPFNEKDSTYYLSDHWPNGNLTGKRNDSSSVMYKFIKCLAYIIKLFTGDLYVLVKNRDIDQTEELLENWETSVKIPEEIPRRDTLTGRREAVKCLISKIPVYNIDNGIVDIRTTYAHYIKCLSGIDVTVRTGRIAPGMGSTFPLTFAVPFGDPTPTGNFHFIISVPVEGIPANNIFPLLFPVSFFNPVVPDNIQNLLDIILERIIPSFCRWTYEAIVI